ncbi:MAG: RtcB family protein [Bacillota bacterium]
MSFFKFPAENNMNCPVYLFASQEIYEEIEDTALQQLLSAATLPGIIHVVGMPDLHQGYGLPIGGVMASTKSGPVSPGAVGFDINCGVRLIKTGLKVDDITSDKDKLLRSLKKEIPAGVGEGSALNLSSTEFKKIIGEGIPALIEMGLTDGTNLNNCEDEGSFPGADPANISSEALSRGQTQVKSLGSGNHFVEVQEVAEADRDSGLEKGELVVMVHTGSRGFGHQIATDYINIAQSVKDKYGLSFPTKNLAHLPWDSQEGRNYLSAMGAAANFAYANREMITVELKKIFSRIFPDSNLRLYHDITHNIARKEEHLIDGKKQEVLVHRKGATRLKHDGTALIPGSMGTSSYVIASAGTENTALALESTAHGAGRKMSRTQAKKTISSKAHLQSLGRVEVASTGKTVLDESPLAYKDIDMVIKSLEISEIALPIARMVPLLCLKG